MRGAVSTALYPSITISIRGLPYHQCTAPLCYFTPSHCHQTKTRYSQIQLYICIHVLTHPTLQLHSQLRQFPFQIEPVLSPNRDCSRGSFSSGKAGQEEEAGEG